MDIEIVKIILDFLGGFAGALIAILVFVLSEKSSWKKEARRINDLEHYLYHTINDFANPIDKQISALEIFIKDLAIETDIAYRPELITSLNSDNVTWISHTDRYKIFVTRRKKKDITLFRDLNTKLKYIDTVADSINSNFQYFKEIKDRFTIQWNSNVKEIGIMKDQMITTYQIANQQTPQNPSIFLVNVDKLFHGWSQMKNFRERNVAVPYLLIPLQTLCRQTNSNSDAIKLLQLINECLLADENIRHIKTFISVESDFLIVSLKDAKTTFLRVAAALRQSK